MAEERAALGHENSHDNEKGSYDDLESVTQLKAELSGAAAAVDSPAAQILGIAILEFGVLLHRCARVKFYWEQRSFILFSVLIGLTLAVDPDFKTLFVVIIFHRKSQQPCLWSPC